MSPKVVVNQSNMKVVVNKSNNTVEVTSPGPQGNFYNSFKGNWSSATAYILGDIVFYNGSSYVAIANNTNSQPPSANWSAVAKGIPGGGTTGQIIVKNSSTDYDYSWTNNYTINTTSPLTGGAAINTNPTLAINATANDTANYVVQRDANQSFSIGAVRFDTSSVQTTAVGKLYWDGNETLNLGLGSTGTVTIALGQEVINYVTNAEATTLNVGEVVYLFGAQGDRPSVKRASNTSDATSAKTFGIVAEAITAGGAGFVVNKGIVSKINTSAYNPGDILWLGATPGTFTTTKPVAPAHLVFVGVVLRANAGNGLVYVSVQNGYELEEIHDVLITSPTDGQFLTYESSTDLWKNKGISATAPITYNAGTRTIAANAASTSAAGVVQLTDSTSSTSTTTAATPNSVKTAYDLANAAAPKTTSIGATAPITSSGTLGTGVTIGVNAASTSAAGVVQLTDSTSSTSTTTAATPNSVKTAYDLANAAIPLSQKAAANGVATLDASGLVPTNQLPALAITNTFVVASQAAMLALSAETGDVAVRTDLSKSFILTATPPSTLANWQELLTPPDAVSSVDGRTGTVTLSDLYAARGTTISTTAPLAGGGDLSANRTLSLNIGSSLTTSASNLIVDSTIVPYLANANTFTAAQTATSFIVTGSTVPANGIYLPAANTLGFATNSTLRLQIDGSGNIAVGGALDTAVNFRVNRNITGGTSAHQITASGTIQSDVTNTAYYLRTFAATQATSFALTNLFHYHADGASIGAGSTITNNFGFTAPSSMTYGTNNFGFYGNIASAANRWNFYANGTAANYFAGQVSIGTTSLTMGSGSASTGLGIFSTAAANVGLVIRGTTSQTGNLQEWQNVSGAVLGIFSPSGQLAINTSSTTMGSGSVAQQLGVFANAATTVGLVIRGNSSQTADLTQWQNFSGTVVANLNPTGVLFVPSVRSTSGTAIAELDLSAGLLVRHSTAANTALRVQNTNASPSGDLQQFQDSSGNVLDAFDNSGNQRSQAQLIQYGAEGSLIQNIPTRVHPGETLLKQAVWWIDAAHVSASSQTIRNLGWGGSALDTTNGSSTSADSNDALYLAWDGINYVYINSGAGNFLSIPDATNLRITGDIDLRAQISPDSWNSGASQSIISKWLGTPQNAYLFRINTTGNLAFFWTENGSTTKSATSSVATGLTNGTTKWVRVTLDVDNGSGGNDARFFTSDDGITWTQLGSTVTTSGVTSIFAGTHSVRVGADDSAGFNGKIYRAQVCNGIDGTPVLDVDTSVISSGAATSFTALTGQTVTVNRSTSGRKTVCVTNPLWLFGTDDYMEVNNRWLEHTGSNYLYLPGVASNYASAPDSAALDITGDIDIRVKVALDDWTPSAQTGLLGKWNGTGGYAYYFSLNTNGTLRFEWGDSVPNYFLAASTVATGIADGSTKWVRATLDVNNGASGRDIQFFTSDDGTTWTQLGTTVTQSGTTSIAANTSQLSIGAVESTGGTHVARGKFFRAQVLNGIGGTVAFDANFETGITSNLPTTFTESSANAATVTVNYSGTGYRSAGVIASTYVYPGNPNTFKLSTTSLLDFGATDSFTMVAIARQWATPNSFGVFFEKRQTSPNNGYSFTNGSTNFRPEVAISDGTNLATNSSTTPVSAAGAVTAYSMIVDRSTQTLYFNINGSNSATVSTSSVGNIASYFPFAVGRRTYTAALYNDMEFVAGAVFRRVLTAREIAILNNYFQGRVA